MVAGDGRAAEFSMDRLAERYLELYTQVAGRAGAADRRARCQGRRARIV